MNIPFSRSLLKSASQKSVRRNEVDKAVRCVKSAIELDMKNVSRRIPIIILEESYAHPNFPKIIEVIRRAQRKSYSFNKEDGELLINTIADAASAPTRDDFFAFHPYKKKIERNKIPIELKGEELALVNSLRYRAKIGGSGFDRTMFEQIASVWEYRFFFEHWTIDDVWKLFPKRHSFKYDEVPNATHKDILLEAVDFHCSPLLTHLASIPKVTKVLKSCYPDLNAEFVLQDVVWKMRSGINIKDLISSGKPLDWMTTKTGYGGDCFLSSEHKEKFELIYKTIEPECDKYAKAFLKKQDKKQEGAIPTTQLFNIQAK